MYAEGWAMKPCSNCARLFHADALLDCSELGERCDALCMECDVHLHDELADEEREREWYRSDAIDKLEGWT